MELVGFYSHIIGVSGHYTPSEAVWEAPPYVTSWLKRAHYKLEKTCQDILRV